MIAAHRFLFPTMAAFLVAGSASVSAQDAESYPASKSYIGQWEYKADGHTFRREFRADGTAEIWADGKIFLHPSGKSWWQGMRWRYDEGLRAIIILNADRVLNSVMQANPRDHDILRDVGERTIARRVPAGREWTGHGTRPREEPRPSDRPRPRPRDPSPTPNPTPPAGRPAPVPAE